MKKNENYGSHAQDRKQGVTKTPRFNDVQFVNYTLPKDVQTSLKERPFTSDQASDAILTLNESGYTVKFKYDEKYSNFSCFLQQQSPDHVNSNMILAGRGSSPMKALKQACFIHYEVCGSDWRGFVEKRVDEMDD